MGWVTCHAETIIEPCERQQLAQHLRDFIDGCEAYGRKILLAKTPVDASLVPAISVTLPSLRVRNKVGGEHILAAPSSMEEIALRRRGRERLEHVRRNGFLQSRPINPLSPPSTTGVRDRRRARRVSSRRATSPHTRAATCSGLA
jgi:hypothetical protein